MGKSVKVSTVAIKTLAVSLSSVQKERSEFASLIAKNPNYFGNITKSSLKPVVKLIGNTSYEKLSCLGYNPETQIMNAVISIHRSAGYGGGLCQAGTFEHVRFYLDFHDGLGFVDQGHVSFKVHDVPSGKDCTGGTLHPISHVVSLPKKDQRSNPCNQPLLPTMRAILSWNVIPPANAPNWTPVWGNVQQADIQLKPKLSLVIPGNIDFSKYFEFAAKFPNLSTAKLSELSGVNLKELNPASEKLAMAELKKASEQQKIPASRFAFKSAMNMMKFPNSEITMMEKSIMSELKIDLSALLGQITLTLPTNKTKANVDYEELECIGLDPHAEHLVATIRIKKKAGYSGSLCTTGSKEYVSFWIDWDNTCKWEYLNTMEIRVFDIAMKGDSLVYSLALPLDTAFRKKLCSNPNIVRVRAVLSWNTPPSSSDPEKLEFYGNRVDTHIQIKPGVSITPGDIKPIFNIIGGIPVSQISNSSGLTLPGSFFAYNGSGVPEKAPFGGILVINGPSFAGHRYRVKVTNLNNGSFYYLNNPISNIVGWLPSAPFVQFTDLIPDSNGYYDYLPVEKNTLSILARFSPGTNDRLMVELEIEGLPGSFGQMIQMDNVAPVISMTIDDDGNCTKYKRGQKITGTFSVNDDNLDYYGLGSTWGITTPIPASGNTNRPLTPFSIQTAVSSYPCGSVSLYARDKTILNSQSVGFEVWASYNICLQNP